MFRSLYVDLTPIWLLSCESSKYCLRHTWGGIEGVRFHAKLHGEAIVSSPTQHGTVGHSRVLVRDMRDPTSALAVIYRLLHKAAMRAPMWLWAGRLGLHWSYLDSDSWRDAARFGPHADTLKFNQVLVALWQRRPDSGTILKVGVNLNDLTEHAPLSRDLFDAEKLARGGLNIGLDQIN